MRMGICGITSNLCRRLAGYIFGVCLIIGYSSGVARADDWLEELLNSLLSVSAGASVGGGGVWVGEWCVKSRANVRNYVAKNITVWGIMYAEWVLAGPAWTTKIAGPILSKTLSVIRC